ncbi:MAG: hypothetical protein Q8M37_05365 [Nevskia sp.]|nr:hypothetical protein [Nevskia sp.]
MFSERMSGQSIVFSEGHYSRGQKMKEDITDGARVELKIQEERVLVRIVETISPGHFRGTIYGFDPGLSVECNGFSIGQKIEFSESHIFTCGHA